MEKMCESPLNFWFRAVERRHRERAFRSAFNRVLMA